MKQRLLALATASALATLLVGCASSGATGTAAVAPAGADSIYLGGPILTMNDAQPNAEAVAVRAGEQRFQADAIVCALGSYGTGFLKPLGIALPVYPVNGYSLTLPMTDANGAPRCTVLDETYKVAITRFDERIRVGGMAELAGFESDTTFFVVAKQKQASALGAIVYQEREPFQMVNHGPMTDSELSRKQSFEWHVHGRNAVAAGHPYLIFKCKGS